MTYCLETYDLSKNFWRKTALKDVNFAVEQGSINAIVGPNGAGKSTLLKVLISLLKPSSGKVTIFGKDSSTLSAQDFNDISFVSEQQLLPERLRLAQVLDYCRDLYKNWDQHYVNSLISDFELDPLQKIGNLSRGNKARVRMLIAMGCQPKLLLLDEMFSGLDPIARDDMTDTLIAVVQKFGATVVLATHEMNEVERLADTVGFLNQAKLNHLYATEELLDNYRVVEVEGTPSQISQLAQKNNFFTLENNELRSKFVTHIDGLSSFKKSTSEFTAQPNFSVSSAELKQIFHYLKNASDTGGPK